MIANKTVFAALALAGALTAGAAQARGNVDVQWGVNIAGPIGVSIYSQPQRVWVPPVVVVPRQVVVQPAYGSYGGYGRGYGDRDRDGIPNRYDRVYNPRWDRDGDGIPNRYDHRDNRGHDRPNDRDNDRDHGRRGPGR